jgi:hypothetical protein
MNCKFLPNGPIIMIFSLMLSIGQICQAMKRPFEEITHLDDQDAPNMVDITDDNDIDTIYEKKQEDASAKKQRSNNKTTKVFNAAPIHKCDYCNNTFFTVNEKKKHTKSHDKTIICSYCNKSFYIKSLNNHIAKAHAKPMPSNQNSLISNSIAIIDTNTAIISPNATTNIQADTSSNSGNTSDIQMFEPETDLDSQTQDLNKILKDIEIPDTPRDNQELINLSSSEQPSSSMSGYIDTANQTALTEAQETAENMQLNIISCFYCNKTFSSYLAHHTT